MLETEVIIEQNGIVPAVPDASNMSVQKIDLVATAESNVVALGAVAHIPDANGLNGQLSKLLTISLLL